ncbi:type II CRISPR RNA-guided endonuclease Cas9 [Flavobacterium cyanobacteriorum]|uniref:CRISPR-associated endonuclease Cas9 n=1 Tax=Flavobacterium cyanobacteriorum TaxID=2022802 RepID=A0A255ZBW8_9FLAO|nr:type II CRISPR RNA-guided endonuclease Cas9 [Flavobacterium cyanobacteriorum]OYQ38414.1 type II CRISPR RNA-guided endonuclease Cas9 [Flavobacterium cyanobacteriorum]
MKKILGLDLGTNSIGWALVNHDYNEMQGKVLGIGSRIIPMSQDIKDEFGKGNSVSQTAERTGFRGIRHLRERSLLRRERLHRVLNVLNFLPPHFASQIDFQKRLGQFIKDAEPKLAYNNNDFIFRTAFEEMLEDFKKKQPEIIKDGKKVPYDWTIFYLRKKALTQKISGEELAWILLNFNQKRGYYQLRGEEDEENKNREVAFYSLEIVDVIADEEPNKKGETWYSLILENGWVYRRSSKTSLLDWKNKTRDFIVTTELNHDGSVKLDKDGVEKRSFRAPGADDWGLVKAKTQNEIIKSEKEVGEYIYDELLKNPTQKIKGKLVRTIERQFYKNELIAILKKQIALQPELFTNELYDDCVRELYRNNEAHRINLGKRDFIHLFVDDILFYQRPLRSQKSSVSNCTLEYRIFKVKDKEGNPVEKKEYLKAMPKSHPLYQEFRVWQWLFNLKIINKDDNSDVTSTLLKTSEDLEQLFAFLMTQKEVNHKDVLGYLLTPVIKEKFPSAKPAAFNKELAKEIAKFRWNYVFDDSKEKEDDKSKKYPCNETGFEIKRRFQKVINLPDGFLTPKIEYQLWHLIYSVNDKKQYEQALGSFARKHDIDEASFVENFKKFPPFKSEYGSFSEKAIKKLLPLMRLGKYWDWNAIDSKTKNRIEKIITGEYDENIKNRVREKAIHLYKENDFNGLQLWLAQYVVYDRHSEAALAGKWNSVAELEQFLKDFKQHSLRNPIVEQVVTETLRVVRDIWIKYGNGQKDFFDEIHVELGREMKKTADERKRLTGKMSENENTNLRIKALLAELLSDSNIQNVRPFSPMQQEALKIYEDGVLNSNIPIPDDILKISKTAQPTKSELQRYKLWLEQKYCSPYTGQIIPLSRLFTNDYEIEHIIPQSRYFDDSFTNKVICESAVNKLKDNQLGLEFIKKHGGTIIETGFNNTVTVFTEDAYKAFIKEHYSKNFAKRSKLLLEEIPDKMIERQMNDTRYISKFISQILSNIVREETNDDGVNSKNVLPGNGQITTILRQDWGLNDVWNELVLPRFERMQRLRTEKDIAEGVSFIAANKNGKPIPELQPVALQKGFQKKRIDHRHHALDALVIACATRDHINLLNNTFAKSNQRFDLNRKLRKFVKVSYIDAQTGDRKEKEVPKEFIKPWETFTQDTKNVLESIVVSFKQNLRVINKTVNRYQSYRDEHGNLRIGKDGKPKKDVIKQVKGDSWAIRKSMHKDTVSGAVKLRKVKEVSLSVTLDNYNDIVDRSLRKHILKLIERKYDKKQIIKYFKDNENNWNSLNVSRLKIYYWDNGNVATRQNLDVSFNENRIIETITDTGIQKILLKHLEQYKGIIDEKGKEIAPEMLAFTPEGIDEMNKNIIALNNGKFHHPILKVRTYEPKGSKFSIGQKGNKANKFVEAAKGTNLFFAIYQGENGQRSYDTVPLNIVIERQKQGLNSVPETNEKGESLLYCLSPNDLVYVPTEEERDNINAVDFNSLSTSQVKRIYKMVSTTQDKLECVPVHYASPILVNEMGSNNKSQNSTDGTQIKQVCVKLNIDRLGNVTRALR